MADHKLIGKDFTPQDVVAKVTGQAKYAEDFRADGMVFCKLLRSEKPHAKVVNIDASEALAMEGVEGILTADDVPAVPAPQDPILTNEPHYIGEPILALAATSETLAADAIEKIKITYEERDFTVDPLDSLYPGGPNARSEGNVIINRSAVETRKWDITDFADADKGRLPMGKPTDEWSVGDIEAAFAKSKAVFEESFVTTGLSHHSMEPRSCMAYWQNGRCYVYGSSQSQSFVVPGLAKYLDIEPSKLVYIAEYCGGGFGSKGSAYPVMAIAPYLSKKIGKPVMMRISRDEEYAFGSGRPGFQGNLKIGFAEDGRVTAIDLYVVQDNGPNRGGGDFRSSADALSITFQPEAMRFRGISVATNTPPRGPQRGPGQNQIAMAVEPLIDKAARQLGLDRVAIRTLNAPDNNGKIGKDLGPVTSAYLKDAFEQGRELFDWETRKKRSGARNGNKVTGLGVASAYHSGGWNGYDGLVRILPDGKLYIHSGVGNLGTYSYGATARAAAEALGYDWQNCVILRGNSDLHLPWNLGQFGSNTSFTMTRSNYAAALDAKAKLLEIAAKVLGGAPEDYILKDEKVVHAKDAGKSITFADAAKKAIDLGGKYSGKELPGDINPMTKASAEAVAGTGLVGVSKDNMPKRGTAPAFTVGFIEIELDTEIGTYEIKDYLGVADCGTVIHPLGLAQQVRGGAVHGFGLAALEHMAYDPKLGRAANVLLHAAKPPSYLDVPPDMKWAAVDKADPDSPIGSRGIGEPVQGCAAAALLCAISDALGGHIFNRTPVRTDMIINALAGKPQSVKPLQTNV